MAAIGSESLMLLAAEGAEGGIAWTDSSGKEGGPALASSGECNLADGCLPGAAAVVFSEEGALELTPPLDLGKEFSVACWFKAPVPPPVHQLAMVVSGGSEKVGQQGPQMVVGGAGFMKDNLGVMVMGQFDACDLKLGMLTDGWHHMVASFPAEKKEDGTSFYVNGVHCGDTEAPLMVASPLAAIGNLRPKSQGIPTNLAAGASLADVRIFAGHRLTADERATLLAQVTEGRGSGPDEAGLAKARGEAVLGRLAQLDGFAEKMTEASSNLEVASAGATTARELLASLAGKIAAVRAVGDAWSAAEDGAVELVLLRAAADEAFELARDGPGHPGAFKRP